MIVRETADTPFKPESFVVATFARSYTDNYARVLENHRLLAFHALGTRRGSQGIPSARTRLKPIFGLLNYAATLTLPTFTAESCRFRLFPLFDRWVKSQLQPGQNLLTSVAYVNECQKWIRSHGGLVIVDSGNLHPRSFWTVLTTEQKIWKSPHPPVARHFNIRGAESADSADYVFAMSSIVRDSFIEQGHDPSRVFVCTHPIDVSWFRPADTERPPSRPITILNTGALCLRKGTPYVLEAFRLILKKEPRAILRLTRNVRDDVKEILRRYADLPIDWSPPYNLQFEDERRRYIERIQSSDIFLFPSIEDGFAIVVAEAMACGLPVITTKNTGASDLVQPGINGEIVPIRDSGATAEAVLKWWAAIQSGKRVGNVAQVHETLGFQTFEKTMIRHLNSIYRSS